MSIPDERIPILHKLGGQSSRRNSTQPKRQNNIFQVGKTAGGKNVIFVLCHNWMKRFLAKIVFDQRLPPPQVENIEMPPLDIQQDTTWPLHGWGERQVGEESEENLWSILVMWTKTIHLISWKCLNYVVPKYLRLRAGASKRKSVLFFDIWQITQMCAKCLPMIMKKTQIIWAGCGLSMKFIFYTSVIYKCYNK